MTKSDHVLQHVHDALQNTVTKTLPREVHQDSQKSPTHEGQEERKECKQRNAHADHGAHAVHEDCHLHIPQNLSQP